MTNHLADMAEALAFFVDHPGVWQLCTQDSPVMQKARSALAATRSAMVAEPPASAHDEDAWTDVQIDQIALAVKESCGPATALRLRAILAAYRTAQSSAAGDGVEKSAAGKALDDPRLQELFSAAIDGALTSGYQGVAPAPAGHWLEYWWKKGQSVAAEQSVQPNYGQMLSLYRRMKNVAAGYSNHCEESGSTRRLDREFEAIDNEARTAIATQPAPPSQWQTAAARDVLAERQRQISAEGWTPEHDDEHDAGELSAAASSYATAAADEIHPYSQGDGGYKVKAPPTWPWAESWWKPGTDPRRMLVKAGALILAEIERLDRASTGETKE